MKIDKPIIEEEININEDLEIYCHVIFKKDIKCYNIISKNGKWNITARNIDAEDIDALDIHAENIDAEDIDAWDIHAENIDARDIICEKRLKKNKDNKTICRVFINNKNKIERKERWKAVKA